MVEITNNTLEIIQRMFPSEQLQREVIDLLQRECSDNIWQKVTPFEMERLWFAVLKLSNGNILRLKREINEAQKDYRDVLMAADFGLDVDEHQSWAAQFRLKK